MTIQRILLREMTIDSVQNLRWLSYHLLDILKVVYNIDNFICIIQWL